MPIKAIASGVVGVIFAILLASFWPLTSVPPGNVGLVSSYGSISKETLSPGLNVIKPWQHVIDFNVQQQKVNVETSAGTHDLQSVTAHVSVVYRPLQSSAVSLYNETGFDYANKLVASALPDRIKSVTAKYTAEELVTKRNDVRDDIKRVVIQGVSESSGGRIVVDDVFVNDFAFSPAYTRAIEEKQVAEQKALTEKNNLAAKQFIAQQAVVAAKAEAEGLAAQKSEITPELIALRQVEMQREAIRKWDGHLPNQMLGGTIPFLNVKK